MSNDAQEKNMKLSNYLNYVEENHNKTNENEENFYLKQDKTKHTSIHEKHKLMIEADEREKASRLVSSQNEFPQNFTFYNLDEQTRNSEKKNNHLTPLPKKEKKVHGFSSHFAIDQTKKQANPEKSTQKTLETDIFSLKSLKSPERKLKASNKLELSNDTHKKSHYEGTYYSDTNWDFESRNEKKNTFKPYDTKLFYEDFYYEKSKNQDQQTLKKSPKLEKPLENHEILISDIPLKNVMSFGGQMSKNDLLEANRKRIFEPMKRNSDANNKKLWVWKA